MIETEPIETIHLYVMREDEQPKPPLLLMLFYVLAFLCLISTGFLNRATLPTIEKTIRVPAVFLPPKVFTASAPIIPTGHRTYPATYARGTLTIYNGSVITQILPAGMILRGKNGIEIATDESITVPAGNPPDYGMATVSAHLFIPGINMSSGEVNQIVGSALYIRNLQPFTGGYPAHTVLYIMQHDTYQPKKQLPRFTCIPL